MFMLTYPAIWALNIDRLNLFNIEWFRTDKIKMCWMCWMIFKKIWKKNYIQIIFVSYHFMPISIDINCTLLLFSRFILLNGIFFHDSYFHLFRSRHKYIFGFSCYKKKKSFHIQQSFSLSMLSLQSRYSLLSSLFSIFDIYIARL